jgi:hypothetical protein
MSLVLSISSDVVLLGKKKKRRKASLRGRRRLGRDLEKIEEDEGIRVVVSPIAAHVPCRIGDRSHDHPEKKSLQKSDNKSM